MVKWLNNYLNSQEKCQDYWPLKNCFGVILQRVKQLYTEKQVFSFNLPFFYRLHKRGFLAPFPCFEHII